MQAVHEDLVEQLVEDVKETRESESFQEWLDAMSQFHDYSVRNQLLIKAQMPSATRVAGYNTWQDLGRQVQGGEEAIYIWRPIITNQCPECGDGPTYHERNGCEYDETPPDEWDEGVVGFSTASVFDISQTEGEPLPEAEHRAKGNAEGLVETVLEVIESEFGYSVELLPDDEYGRSSDGVTLTKGDDIEIEVRNSLSTPETVRVLVHELAHAIRHGGMDSDNPEKSKREVEADGIAYVVCSHLGLDVSDMAFYLASWEDDPEAISDRVTQISNTAQEIIEAIDAALGEDGE
jgi:hypothetical protein